MMLCAQKGGKGEEERGRTGKEGWKDGRTDEFTGMSEMLSLYTERKEGKNGGIEMNERRELKEERKCCNDTWR